MISSPEASCPYSPLGKIFDLITRFRDKTVINSLLHRLQVMFRIHTCEQVAVTL